MRIYGKIKNRWTTTDTNGIERPTQIEIEYKDITEAGDLKATGTEDFSIERYRTALELVRVFTWDGEKLNKGGQRWFEDQGTFRIRKSDRKSLREYIQTREKAEAIRTETI